MPSFAPSLFCASLLMCSIISSNLASASHVKRQDVPATEKIASAFGQHGVQINKAEVVGIRANVELAIKEALTHGLGNSKIDFAAIEIASDLGLGTDNATIRRIVAAIGELLPPTSPPAKKPLQLKRPEHHRLPAYLPQWESYFESTINLGRDQQFMGLMRQNQFFPVKISWEDIGRHQGSVWGDRISDVGIWVRRDESDPTSARLALSVRRDSNFRDKVFMVPAEKIKVHIKKGERTVEKTLPQRLAELGLASPARDKNVIVSNQFAIVPVPFDEMDSQRQVGTPPRVAFNFSIFPYGSTNYVITDVIEGSSEAIVGPGTHQLLYANIDGQKAPFTASRAEDRPDLLKLESELKKHGMDVDVQRYYLVQVPLRRNAKNIVLSNMGTPPVDRGTATVPNPVLIPKKKLIDPGISYPDTVNFIPNDAPTALIQKDYSLSGTTAETQVIKREPAVAKIELEAIARNEPGMTRVAIGHGEPEGLYSPGSGYRGARADEPIRVTVVYFVTPKGSITETDMHTFTSTFSQWDSQAIWGGSFVTKE